MKSINIALIVFYIFIIFWVVKMCSIKPDKQSINTKFAIDFPEEINAMNAQDTLIGVLRNDTLYLEFLKHY